MPHHKSAWKRMRTNEKRRLRNRAVRSRVRKAIKKFRLAPIEEKPQLLRKATSELDNAVRKGVIKDRTAIRYKSRLARLLNKLQKEAATT